MSMMCVIIIGCVVLQFVEIDIGGVEEWRWNGKINKKAMT